LIANQFAKYQTESFENRECKPPLKYDKASKLLRKILAHLKEQDQLNPLPPPGTVTFTHKERLAIKQWTSTLTFDQDGKPSIGLPWQRKEPRFRDNS
jgi:hypothetical protein